MSEEYDMGALANAGKSQGLSNAILEQNRKNALNNSKNYEPSSCCFGIFGSSKNRQVSIGSSMQPELQEQWQNIFEDFMIRYSQHLTWIDTFLKYKVNFSLTHNRQVRKIMGKSYDQTKKLQKDFEIASYNIYQQGIQEVKVLDDDYFQYDSESSQKEPHEQQHNDETLKELQQKKLKNMVNTNLREYQVKLYQEIEKQVQSKGHPAQLVNKQFKTVFVKYYQQYISKDMYDDQQLLENIIKKTVGLQSEYVFKMAEQFELVEDRKIETELKKKREITLANTAIDDVKIFYSAMYQFIKSLYQEHIEPNDYKEIQEDIGKMIINMMVKDDVFKVLICLQRIDNFNGDKDLRMKYVMMKGIKTTDFGIDPYLCMADPIVLVKEAARRYKIDVDAVNELSNNSTVQNIDLEDIVNVEFKEFIQKNKQKLELFPLEVKTQIYEKAKIRPFQKTVVRFRDIMVKPFSPMEKLFMLQDLKHQIQEDILEFWGPLINDPSKLQLNRDEQTSILLFIISKAEIPDLISQVKLITEFTSNDIQESVDGYYISDTFTLFYTTVQWISSLDKEKLVLDKSYLLKANVQIKEDMNIRYDKIVIKDGSDRYDPFSMAVTNPVRNSYIDEKGISALIKKDQNEDSLL